MSAQSEFVERLYDLTVEYVSEHRPPMIDTLAIAKTYHSVVLEQLIVNADVTPKEKLAVLNGYFMALADDVVRIKNSLVVLVQ